MTPAEITAAIARLNAALAAGELTVEYAGRRVTYKSTDDLLKALSYLKSEASSVAPGEPAPASASRTTYAAFERD